MADLNIFDADKWRETLRKFDATRAEFLAAVSNLQSRKAPSSELEKERQKLLREAAPINASMNALLSAMQQVREWLKQFSGAWGSIFGGGSTLQAIPLIGIGISLGAVALVISSAGAFVEKFKKYDTLRAQVEAAAKAGASGEDIAKIGAPPKVQRKFLGLDAGAVPWVFGLAALVIAGPYIMKQIERRF